MIFVPNLEYCNNRMKGDVMQETEKMWGTKYYGQLKGFAISNVEFVGSFALKGIVILNVSSIEKIISTKA